MKFKIKVSAALLFDLQRSSVQYGFLTRAGNPKFGGKARSRPVKARVNLVSTIFAYFCQYMPFFSQWIQLEHSTAQHEGRGRDQDRGLYEGLQDIKREGHVDCTGAKEARGLKRGRYLY